MYSTVVEHFVTQQLFKHCICVRYHYVNCIQTCRKRCWEKLYNVNLRYYDCWRKIAHVLVTTVHFSWYQWFTSERIQVATAVQSYNLAPLYEFSLVWGASLMLQFVFSLQAQHMPSCVRKSCTLYPGTHCFVR